MIINISNSSLAGLVLITGICNDVNAFSSIAIGLFSGIIYLTSNEILERYRIDSPVDSVQIHGICGFFGVVIIGILGQENGLFGNNANKFIQLGVQFIGAVALTLWAAITSYIYFKLADSLGRLRVPLFYEVVGLDLLMHTESDKLVDMDSISQLDFLTSKYKLDEVKVKRMKTSVSE